MARPLSAIITHLRACIADGSIKTTLIQTEDLAALCDAVDPPRPPEWEPLVQEALTPRHGWKVQPFKYYAAQYLVGSGLIHGDLIGHINGLASAMQAQYDIGVEHGRGGEENARAPSHPQ